MKSNTKHWDKEYSSNNPRFKALISNQPSKSILKFVNYLQAKRVPLKGTLVEVGCGMGRNINYFSQLGLNAIGLDISKVAIREAKKRARFLSVKPKYFALDASKRWPFKNSSVDFVIDVTTSHLMDSKQLKGYVVELTRVLKPTGHLFLYTLDRSKDKSAKDLLKERPGPEKNTYIIPEMNHLERVYTLTDIKRFFQPLKVVASELIFSPTEFSGKIYEKYYWWVVLTPKT